MKLEIPHQAFQRAVMAALREDVGKGDITTLGIVQPGEKLRASIFAQAPGVLAGIPAVYEVYKQLDRSTRLQVFKKDGERLVTGERILRLQGPASAVLTGERTALNFLGMLSGIATKTAEYVEAVKGTSTKVLDTRKTTPGLRRLVKYAVTAGGGYNHRMGLYDAVLIKDNHIALANHSVSEAIARVRKKNRKPVMIEVEAENLAQVREAITACADIILLDNLVGLELQRAVKLINRRALSEVSGGLDLKKTAAAARLGVDRVSVGAITHSVPWLSMHMEVD